MEEVTKLQTQYNIEEVEVGHEMDELKSKRNSLYTARRVNTPKLPKSIYDIELTDGYTKTLSGDEFLLIDSKDKDRIISFASNTVLDILSKHQQWHVDGTFKSSSKIYFQNVSELVKLVKIN